MLIIAASDPTDPAVQEVRAALEAMSQPFVNRQSLVVSVLDEAIFPLKLSQSEFEAFGISFVARFDGVICLGNKNCALRRFAETALIPVFIFDGDVAALAKFVAEKVAFAAWLHGNLISMATGALRANAAGGTVRMDRRMAPDGSRHVMMTLPPRLEAIEDPNVIEMVAE